MQTGAYSTEQVYYDPQWDWKTNLTYENYATFFDKTVRMIEPMIGTDNADLSRFRCVSRCPHLPSNPVSWWCGLNARPFGAEGMLAAS